MKLSAVICCGFAFLRAFVSYSQNALSYFEERIGTPNAYEDGIAYYINNQVQVKVVSLQNHLSQTNFYIRQAQNDYKLTATPLLKEAPKDNYMIVPLIQATYLRIENENKVKSVVLPENVLYHTVCATEKHIFVVGDKDKNAHFVTLDKEGNILYEYTFNYPHPNQIKCIAEDEAGNLYLAGYMEGALDDTFNAWLVKLSSQKEILWSRLYGTSQGTDEFYHVELTPNGLLCSGLTYQNNNFDAYVLHTDREGKLFSVADFHNCSYLHKKVLLNAPVKK
ncbi:MAG: hypothetical protein NZ519_11265 [Bacteroidia bacterium]|nr:hypothetical protein [Bacteroidia bacterium]MDW8302385.1 hypothetical protein [Bacteroidia bacterium]